MLGLLGAVMQSRKKSLRRGMALCNPATTIYAAIPDR
jgi:hypothetical protein